jgi:hypothetical protein
MCSSGGRAVTETLARPRGAATAGWGGGRLTRRGPELPELLRRFPPRQQPASWEATELSRGRALARTLAAPFTFSDVRYQASVRRGVSRVLDWLAEQPGSSWQDRWIASGAEQHADWRQLAVGRAGLPAWDTASSNKSGECSAGLRIVICADVIRPSLDWLLLTPAPKHLAAAMARTRDPAAFAELAAVCQAQRIGQKARHFALARIAMIMAAKGGLAAGITVGDCIEMMQESADARRRAGKGRGFSSTFFYQLLRSAGTFPAAAPSTTRAFATRSATAKPRRRAPLPFSHCRISA